MKNKKLYWQIPFLLVLLIGSIIIVRCQHDMPYQHNTGFIFGTVYHITYQNDEDLQPEIDAELKRVNQTFSTFEPSSVISLINQNKPVKVNEMFDLELPESDDYMTIGGLILHVYQSFPKLNEIITIGQYEFKIIKSTMTKIELVKLKVNVTD